MKTSLLMTTFTAFLLTATACASTKSNEIDLFELEQRGNANWTQEGDAITATTGNGFLVTNESYENFELSVEFQAAEKSNSGIFFRCEEAASISDQKCFEANIFDTRPDQTFRTGAITTIAAPEIKVDTEDGNWHRYEIKAQGEFLVLKIDGKKTVALRNPLHKSGPIAFQFAAGGVKFRALTIKRLAPSNLEGVWNLTGFDLIDAQGVAKPWCEGAFGVIIYTQWYMSVAINCADGKKMLHYSGPYYLENDFVVHDVQNYSDLSLKQVFKRQVTMPDQDTLLLTGAVAGGGKAVISWAKR